MLSIKRNRQYLITLIGFSCLISYPIFADNLQKVAALVEALRRAAPRTDDPSLYTEWKMQAGAIASWTRRCVGTPILPQELIDRPIMVRDTVTCVMEPILAEQLRFTGGDETTAVRRAAAWWMTGDVTYYKSSRIAGYLNRVVNEYQKLRSDQ